jgi:hypothetical protein
MDFDSGDGPGHLMVAASFGGPAMMDNGKAEGAKRDTTIKLRQRCSTFNCGDEQRHLKVAVMDDGVRHGRQ